MNVLISQPRKIAAISIAKRVSDEVKCTFGGLVGYQVGLNKKLNKADKEKTQILFCTTGVIIQKLIKQHTMETYTHIILDEIHERDVDTDLLMTIIREFIFDNIGDTRLILMSATLDAMKYQKYFTLNDGKKNIVPPVITMKIDRPYKIEISYLDDLVELDYKNDLIEYQRQILITHDMYQLIGNIVKECLKESQKSILVFFPGVFEIESMHTVLMKLEDIKEKCLVTIFHAQLPGILLTLLISGIR